MITSCVDCITYYKTQCNETVKKHFTICLMLHFGAVENDTTVVLEDISSFNVETLMSLSRRSYTKISKPHAVCISCNYIYIYS